MIRIVANTALFSYFVALILNAWGDSQAPVHL